MTTIKLSVQRILTLLVCLYTHSAYGQYPILELSPPGVRIDKLPGYDILNPVNDINDIEITMIPATIISPLRNGSLLYRFNAPVYLDTSPGSSGKPFIFGPTIRFKRGERANIKLTNNLTNPSSDSDMQFGVGITNLHTHGLYVSPGQLSQGPPTYTTGDNIFVDINPGESLAIENDLPINHLPGLHWYHPHKHGSTSSQAFTSNGLIIVNDDDDAWLPDDNGCAQIKNIMVSVPDYLLHIELLTFGPPTSSNVSDANYQTVSEEGNSTLCCGESPSNELTGLGEDEDIAFINGGYQPVIPATSGKWQRWRLAHTGYKRYMVLQIIDPVLEAPTDACEIQLLAKDGIYLLNIPRRTDYIFLSAANRAEVLVRCSGPPGKEYVLSSGHLPLPIGGGSDFPSATQMHTQRIMATIRISENNSGSNDEDLVIKGCTPLRPSYAANFLNAPADKTFYDNNATFDFTTKGCLIGGKNFTYPDSNPLQMPMGKVVEWRIADLAFHPWHAHVNPFQITNLSLAELVSNMTYTNWFEDGDFHDTLQLPMVNNGTAGVRSQPGPFGGYAVAHCHFLQHEDAGCMRVLRFSCVDGDVQPSDCSPYFTYPVPGSWKSNLPPSPSPSASPTGAAQKGVGSFHVLSFFCALYSNYAVSSLYSFIYSC